MPNVFLYNIDDLQNIADESMQQRKDEISRCVQIIEEKAAALLEDKGGPWGSCQDTPGLRRIDVKDQASERENQFASDAILIRKAQKVRAHNE